MSLFRVSHVVMSIEPIFDSSLGNCRHKRGARGREERNTHRTRSRHRWIEREGVRLLFVHGAEESRYERRKVEGMESVHRMMEEKEQMQREMRGAASFSTLAPWRQLVRRR